MSTVETKETTIVRRASELDLSESNGGRSTGPMIPIFVYITCTSCERVRRSPGKVMASGCTDDNKPVEGVWCWEPLRM